MWLFHSLPSLSGVCIGKNKKPLAPWYFCIYRIPIAGATFNTLIPNCVFASCRGSPNLHCVDREKVPRHSPSHRCHSGLIFWLSFLLPLLGDAQFSEAVGYPMVQQWRVRSNLYKVKLSSITLSTGCCLLFFFFSLCLTVCFWYYTALHTQCNSD